MPVFDLLLSVGIGTALDSLRAVAHYLNVSGLISELHRQNWEHQRFEGYSYKHISLSLLLLARILLARTSGGRCHTDLPLTTHCPTAWALRYGGVLATL